MAEPATIGIDLGGTRIKIGVVRKGCVLVSEVVRAYPGKGLKAVLPELEELIVRLAESENIEIKAVGMSFPGIVDSLKGQVIDTSGKYSDATDVDLNSWVKEAFGVPFRMDNDARLACLGEWQYGAGEGVANMVMLTLGTGIGTAAVIDGQLLQGRHFQAGILGGHLIIDYKNKVDRCSCGRYGCVEGIASMWMIEDKARQHPLFGESSLSKVDRIHWKVILELAEEGDQLSEILKEHCLEVWGICLINLIHAYDPERVVIGGGISYAEGLILPYFKKIVKERAWCAGGYPEIRKAKFPDTAGLLGIDVLFE